MAHTYILVPAFGKPFLIKDCDGKAETMKTLVEGMPDTWYHKNYPIIIHPMFKKNCDRWASVSKVLEYIYQGVSGIKGDICVHYCNGTQQEEVDCNFATVVLYNGVRGPPIFGNFVIKMKQCHYDKCGIELPSMTYEEFLKEDCEEEEEEA